MDVVSLSSNVPLLVTFSDFVGNLDGANAVIGVITLGIGLLGVAYLVLTFMATPQPQTEAGEAEPYPDIDRLIVPVLLPIGVGCAIALIIFCMSQIMLVVSEEVTAPIIALGMAVLILLACSMVANAPRVSRGMIYGVLGLPLLALVVAGAWAGIVRYNQNTAAAAAAAAAAANAPQTALTETTTDNAFKKTTFNVPAGQQITLTLTNNGQAIHNWHLLDVKDDSGKDITTGQTGTNLRLISSSTAWAGRP